MADAGSDGGGGAAGTPGPDPLAALPAELRAAASAALLHLGSAAPRVLARIANGAAAADAARSVLALERALRARLLARAVVGLRAPVPAGVDAVHADWQPDVGRDPATAAALAQGAAIDDRVQTWLQRRAYGGLVAMPAVDAGGAAALARLEAGRLIRALTAWGRRTLAAVSVSAPRGQIAELASRLGDLHGPAFIAEVADAVAAGAAPDRWAREVRRALAGRRVSTRGLVSIALERLASLLAAAGGDLVRQVAQRLPRELGVELFEAADRCARRESRDGGADAGLGPEGGGRSRPERAGDGVDAGAELASLLACFDE